MLTQVQKEAIYQRLTVNTEAIDRLLIRANAYAEDITDLARDIRRLTERIEKLEERED